MLFASVYDCVGLAEALKTKTEFKSYGELTRYEAELLHYDDQTIQQAVEKDDTSLIGGIPIPVAQGWLNLQASLQHSGEHDEMNAAHKRLEHDKFSALTDEESYSFSQSVLPPEVRDVLIQCVVGDGGTSGVKANWLSDAASKTPVLIVQFIDDPVFGVHRATLQNVAVDRSALKPSANNKPFPITLNPKESVPIEFERVPDSEGNYPGTSVQLVVPDFGGGKPVTLPALSRPTPPPEPDARRKFTIPANKFDPNESKHIMTDGGYGPEVILNKDRATSIPHLQNTAAFNFTTQDYNTVGGRYHLSIEYASPDNRPVQVWVNHKLVNDMLDSKTNGDKDFQLSSEIVVDLVNGSDSIVIKCGGHAIPNIRSLVFTPVPK